MKKTYKDIKFTYNNIYIYIFSALVSDNDSVTRSRYNHLKFASCFFNHIFGLFAERTFCRRANWSKVEMLQWGRKVL